MTETNNAKPYDLEERTLRFAKEVITFVNAAPKTIANNEVLKQVIRSSGSVGANYIEANEALSKKDFAMRIKICRKEAKESEYWLKQIEVGQESDETKRQKLVGEATELRKIFGSIVEKVKQKYCALEFVIYLEFRAQDLEFNLGEADGQKSYGGSG